MTADSRGGEMLKRRNTSLTMKISANREADIDRRKWKKEDALNALPFGFLETSASAVSGRRPCLVHGIQIDGDQLRERTRRWLIDQRVQM
jgi:hypothetical protein